MNFFPQLASANPCADLLFPKLPFFLMHQARSRDRILVTGCPNLPSTQYWKWLFPWRQSSGGSFRINTCQLEVLQGSSFFFFKWRRVFYQTKTRTDGEVGCMGGNSEIYYNYISHPGAQQKVENPSAKLGQSLSRRYSLQCLWQGSGDPGEGWGHPETLKGGGV